MTADEQRVTIKAVPGALLNRVWRVIDGIPTTEQASAGTEVTLPIPSLLAPVQPVQEANDEEITEATITHVRAELHRWAIPYLEGPQDPDEAKALAPRLRGLADALAARPTPSE